MMKVQIETWVRYKARRFLPTSIITYFIRYLRIQYMFSLQCIQSNPKYKKKHPNFFYYLSRILYDVLKVFDY